ncbi:MAG: Ig-like domain-containing protein, partial [Thermoplasmata archaeon]|nr:Ig-like domain-containing protein [Thermoplasmata archaeon]
MVGGDSNNVGIIRRTGNLWEGKVIFTDTDKIRGIGIGDVDPINPGNEILTFSYSNRVTLITGSGEMGNARTSFIDDGRSHDLALGEFDPLHIGQELVIGGYSNNVTMIMNSQLTEEPDFSMYAYPTTQSIYSNDKVDYTIGVIALSGFNEPVEFSVEDLPEWISSNIYPSSIIPDSTATLTISVPVTKNKEDIYFTINASSGKLYHLFDLRLNLIGDTEPPEVESTYPIDKDENINPQSPIVIWFNEPVDPNSITEDSVTIIEDESGSVFIGDHEYIEESNMLMVTDIHAQNDAGLGLPNSKLIKITLTTSISDLAGNKLSKNYQFEYLTSEEDISPIGSLEIKSVYPEQDAAGVPINSPIIIEFSTPIDDKTLTWDNIEITSDKGDKYTGSINYDPHNLVLTINDIQL